jgi:heptosyltransferase-1
VHVLLIKMSSMGDVVHALPAVTDAASHGVTFDWVVEEAFADIPALHPAVGQVMPIAWRRWRSSLRSSRGELARFWEQLRRRRYDLVLDSQGLVKSGVVAALARGRTKAGFSHASARERAAALAYRRGVRVARNQHAIDRQRELFAAVFGYCVPAGLDYGIARPAHQASKTNQCVLLHGTTWESKHYPEHLWREVARRARAAGLDVALPWGSEAERARAEAIAMTNADVLPALNLAELTTRIAAARLVVGVDSGLAHLSAALDVPTVVIYGSTDSALTGCRGRRVSNLQAQFPCAPCLRKACGYHGPEEILHQAPVRPACYSRVTPDAVWDAAARAMADGGRETAPNPGSDL